MSPDVVFDTLANKNKQRFFSAAHRAHSDLSGLLVCSQLLGFVYACYVVSAITEEEDSCELLYLTHTLTHTQATILQTT